MAFLTLDSNLIERMNFMGEIDRLLRFGTNAEKMLRGVAVTGMSRGESGRTPSFRCVWVGGPAGITGNVGLLHASQHHGHKNQEQRHRTDARMCTALICL